MHNPFQGFAYGLCLRPVCLLAYRARAYVCVRLCLQNYKPNNSTYIQLLFRSQISSWTFNGMKIAFNRGVKKNQYKHNSRLELKWTRCRPPFSINTPDKNRQLQRWNNWFALCVCELCVLHCFRATNHTASTLVSYIILKLIYMNWNKCCTSITSYLFNHCWHILFTSISLTCFAPSRLLAHIWWILWNNSSLIVNIWICMGRACHCHH